MARLTDSDPFVHPDCTITDCTLGRFTEIGRGSRLAHSVIGDYAYCDRSADIANADVGRFANIASFVRIGASDHPLDRASLHHFMYRSDDYWDDAEGDAAWFAYRKSRRAMIGRDTWIGHNAQIKPDVVVGDGAVVASGAVVTRDVGPYEIVAGVPACPLRRRLPPELADRMIALGWWDWSHDLLRARLDDFRQLSAEAFLTKFEPGAPG